MTVKTTARPKPGDIAFVPNAAIFGQPWFRIDRAEFNATGDVTGYYLSSPGSQSDSTYVEAARVSAVLSNILTPQE